MVVLGEHGIVGRIGLSDKPTARIMQQQILRVLKGAIADAYVSVAKPKGLKQASAAAKAALKGVSIIFSRGLAQVPNFASGTGTSGL